MRTSIASWPNSNPKLNYSPKPKPDGNPRVSYEDVYRYPGVEGFVSLYEGQGRIHKVRACIIITVRIDVLSISVTSTRIMTE